MAMAIINDRTTILVTIQEVPMGVIHHMAAVATLQVQVATLRAATPRAATLRAAILRAAIPPAAIQQAGDTIQVEVTEQIQ